MVHNWVDLIFLIAAALSIFRGWRAGLLESIFSAIGFVGGGVVGLYAAISLFHKITSTTTKFGIFLLAISIGSWLGHIIFKKVASLIHNRVFFGPFKWIDSLLGALFSLLRTALMLLLLAHILLITPWSWAQQKIPQSKIYTKLNSYAPTLITEITKKAESA